LGQRLALVLLPLVLIPLIIMGVLAYYRSRTILETQAKAQLVSGAQGQATSLESWVDIREQRMQIASQRSELLEALSAVLDPGDPQGKVAMNEEALTLLQELLTYQGVVLFSNLAVADPDTGEIIIATNEDWIGEEFNPIVNDAVPTNAIYSYAFFDDPLVAPGDVALLTSTPLRAAGGEVDSMLLGINTDIRLAALMDQIQAFWVERGVYRVIRGGTYLATAPDLILELPRNSMAIVNYPKSDHPIFQLPSDALSGTAEYEAQDGTTVLGAYEWIPEWNLGVIVELPRDEVFAELNSLAPFTLGLIAAAAVLTVIVVLLTMNRMLQPLSQLTDFSQRLARGEWKHRVPEDRSDEIGVLAFSFNRMADDLSGMYRSLEERVEERTRQIRTASDVARVVTSTPTLDDLLRKAVELIRDRFGYYHVSIFLLDEEGKNAVMQESTGEVGQALIARGHSLEVGSQSIIGWVSENNNPRIASDVGQDPIHFSNELLPETRSEAAVPLQVSGQVLGVLDVQSTQPNAFKPEDIEILQTLADQLSAAILNARLAQSSSQAAERARFISDVTRQLSGLLDVESVLETSGNALYRSMGRPEIVIQLSNTESREMGPVPDGTD
jgi:HAMP domain-containing protein